MFITQVTNLRRPLFAETGRVELLREAIRKTMNRWPFSITAMVVMPDHFHCMMQLPENEEDYSTRIRLIKDYFSRTQTRLETTASREKKGDKGVWQRRFWAHIITDENDWQRHIDYIHYNPVKHGLTRSAMTWPFSSFARFQQQQLYPQGWGEMEPENIKALKDNYE